MSASLLSGNAALGLSSSPLRPGGAKAATKDVSGESAFQLAVGSAGEGGRPSADRQPGTAAGETAPEAEETVRQMSRPTPADDAAPRLHKWILGMDGGPAAGDLLLSGGALTSEEGAPAAPSDAADAGGDKVRPGAPPRLEAETQDPAPADTSPPAPEETAGTRAVADGGAPSSGGLMDVAADPVEFAERAHRPAEASKPAPVGGSPAAPVQGAANNPAGGNDPAVDRHGDGQTARIMNSEPLSDPKDQPAQPDRIAVQASPHPRPVAERVAADKANAVPEPRNAHAVGTAPASVPVAAIAGPGVATATRQPAVGPKAVLSSHGGSVQRSDIEVPDRTTDDTGRNQQVRDPVDQRRPDRRPASADPPGPSVVVGEPGGQSAAPTAQPPTVTVVEARQYAAPQQANSEAIVRAVSGNELWSAALRNEAPVQNGAPLQTLKIKLNPAELGMVDATLRLVGDRLAVELSVQTVEAYRQLSDSRQTVLNALRGQGYGVEQISVQLSAPDRGGQHGPSTGHQQGGFEGQLTQDNSRQSGEGGRSGQENGNGDERGSGSAPRGETPAGEAPSLPPGAAADGAVYL